MPFCGDFSKCPRSILADIPTGAAALTTFYYLSFPLTQPYPQPPPHTLPPCLVTYVISLPPSSPLHTADSDAETDEDEGHIEDAEKAQQREREKHDESEELSNKDIQDTDEEVAVSLLRAKNLSLLQSQ